MYFYFWGVIKIKKEQIYSYTYIRYTQISAHSKWLLTFNMHIMYGFKLILKNS
jgi:hypothetical protein